METKEIYLDNNASTPVPAEVRDAMLPFLDMYYGNPSSVHRKGVEAERALKDARRTIASALGVDEREIVFTSGATESTNAAIQGAARANQRRGKHIVTSTIEHDAVLGPCEALEKEGFEVTYLQPDAYGRITPDQVADSVRDDTILVAIMHVHNELGTVYPIGEIARAVKRANPHTLVFSDGAQSFGKIPVNAADVDLFAASGQKIHAPKGIGMLYIKSGSRVLPLISGGQQEFGLRAGTQNVPGAVALAKALELAEEADDAHVASLRDKLISGISEISDTRINSPEDGVATTVNAAFYGIPAEVLLHALEQRGIYVSTGSACAGGAVSHVLKALPIDEKAKRSSIRISLSRYTTKEDVEQTVAALKEIVPELRKITARNDK